ncbi:MAG: Na+/H+ antiporter subunit E [Zestosphaera sp.]
MRRLYKSIVPVLLSFIIYVVYTGTLRLYDILTGFLVALVIGVLTSNLLIEDWRKSLSLRRFVNLVRFAFRYFFIDEVKAHLLLIKLSLSPKLDLRPAIVKMPIKTRNDYGITLVSLSITNTPGTVVVDLNKEKGNIYVHWIYAKTTKPEESYKEVSEVFDTYALKVFD